MELEKLDEEYEDVLGSQNESNSSSSTCHEGYMKDEKHDHGTVSIVESLNQLVEDKLRVISLCTLLTLIIDVSQYAVMNVGVLRKSFHR